MSETSFRFRQFLIQQNKSAMKVGTDAVLLGSWVNAENAKSILDIGTGTGVIAIMLAQKSDTKIDAIDIDKDSCEEARTNADASPWGKRIEIFITSLQVFSKTTEKKYQLIVSNPPYFEYSGDSSSSAKTKAKHTDKLSHKDLISGINDLLKADGKFCVILPFNEGTLFSDMAYLAGIYCRKKLRVITKKGKTEKRVLMEFSRQMGICEESELVMLDEKMNYTKEYIELTKEYYPELSR